ncbi:uncharacterized protein PGTG_13769 [Puccinia graminis f. sp. tritici CRL 75-36-700-3]|uniref:Uncharacterized protein n=1 Tax=Puccinia graminis f. sp. tritici (strain CRL 75-36-700-3 / race SCCL) TaxID=418459 RepID=E3KUL5_PUCGT|nr:uncharacterized protein PGTG_13769 [Puccinia graminis f. sp. tritici CRL 75-36-700-3]EFP87965.1 hypothetical protein PGTG_13769 [Puccinia graminis f. sp. tritici CRL 75-36-700-3]
MDLRRRNCAGGGGQTILRSQVAFSRRRSEDRLSSFSQETSRPDSAVPLSFSSNLFTVSFELELQSSTLCGTGGSYNKLRREVHTTGSTGVFSFSPLRVTSDVGKPHCQWPEANQLPGSMDGVRRSPAGDDTYIPHPELSSRLIEKCAENLTARTFGWCAAS